MLAGADGERLWAFWAKHLQDAPTTVPLPRAPVAEPHRQGPSTAQTHRLCVPQRIAARVRHLARNHHTTPYTVLLSAFAATLAEHTGQEDVLVASPVTGRTRPGTGRVVGSFAHPLVVRVTTAADDTFLDLLTRTRDRVAAALEHQDYPFPLLVRRIKPIRDGGRPPLAQVMFDYVQTSDQLAATCAAYFAGRSGLSLATGDLVLESLPIHHQNQIDHFELALVLAGTGKDMPGALHHRRQTVDARWAERLCDRFLTRLLAVTEEPMSPANVTASRE